MNSRGWTKIGPAACLGLSQGKFARESLVAIRMVAGVAGLALVVGYGGGLDLVVGGVQELVLLVPEIEII